ncbi:hypothetical protein ACFQAT_06340 [Undibacterium arcticum]
MQLTFGIEGGEIYATLEWVLAHARRIGLTLLELKMPPRTPAGQHTAVAMHVAARQAEPLNLFVARLENGVDLTELRYTVASVATCTDGD